MNAASKVQLIVATVVTIALAGAVLIAIPSAGDILAGVAITGALLGMGALEMKKRAY